jgi:exosortase/archaeosortase family protein
VANLTVPQFSFLTLLITLGAVALDQFAAPALYSSSPLWAAAACMALVWRRGEVEFEPETGPRKFGFSFRRNVGSASYGFSLARIALFAGAHVVLVSAVRLLNGTLGPVVGTVSFAGWITAATKLSVLVPTLLLFPLKRWHILARTYAAEGVAALVVLFTFFPGRILTALWPWYGQVLGRVVFFFARLFVPGLSYVSAFTPTLDGPDLDVTILQACSGISGIELFDCLFAFVALLDWNRLRKGRALLAYFGGIGAMFLGNALRISALVILGNRGFADVIARFHVSAGWIFFSAVFVLYLSLTYRKLLVTTS